MKTIPYPFSESSLGIDYTIKDALDSFSTCKNWIDRYRQLFKLADKIVPMKESWRNDDNLVKDCESPVWLIHHYDQVQKKHFILADSDSKIIKGLLVLILCACNGQSDETILAFDLKPMLVNLDFGKYLTPSRTSGLISVISILQNNVTYIQNSNIRQ